MPERIGSSITNTTEVPDTENWYVRGWGNELENEASGTINDWYLQDRLGSVRATTTNAGVFIADYNFEPYGSPEGTNIPENYGYAGEPQYSNTGLVQLRDRWYNTIQGRFASTDRYQGSTGNPRSFQRFAYAKNNPINNIDPSGFISEACLLPPMVDQASRQNKYIQLQMGVLAYGFTFSTANGGFDELDLTDMLQTITDYKDMACWSSSDFMAAMNTHRQPLQLVNDGGDGLRKGARHTLGRGSASLGMFVPAFRNSIDPNPLKNTACGVFPGASLLNDRNGKDTSLAFKAYFAHELSHVWDISTNHGQLGRMYMEHEPTQQFASGPVQALMNGKDTKDDHTLIRAENWADSVATLIYPNFIEYVSNYSQSAGSKWIYEATQNRAFRRYTIPQPSLLPAYPTPKR